MIRRFKWLSASRFVICDPEGNERIINIDKNYEEESFNAIPLFKELFEHEYNIKPQGEEYVDSKRLYFDSPSDNSDT